MTFNFSKPAARRLYKLTFLAILVLSGGTARAAGDSPDYEGVRSGTLFLSGEQASYDAVVLHSNVRMHIAGVVADVQMSQDFKNVSDEWVEGIYVFPLPENASIRAMTIRIGERLIEGRILEKQAAQQRYTEAKEQGQVAGLIRQERSNLFTTKIANIAPGEKISVELDYFQTLEQNVDQYSLRLPTTLTPRYIPEGTITAAGFSENPQKTLALLDDAVAISPPQKISPDATSPTLSLQISLASDQPLDWIDSASHPIDIVEQDDRYLISLNQTDTAMDRDFVLSWQAAGGTEPQPALYVQESDAERYGLLVVSPPAASAVDSMPREMILVIDTSGSMAGQSIRAAKSALLSALDKLQPADTFNIIEFNDRAQQLYPGPQRANPQQIANAKRFIKQLGADGGTEMREALTLALQQQDPERLRQIIFITDGSVGNERELLHLLHSQLDSARLFTVGIGSAPNGFFMRKAAEFGRGTFSFIEDTRQAEQTMTALFERLRAPVLTDVSLASDSQTMEFYPAPLPDLYAGQPLVVAAKLPDDLRQITVTGKTNGAEWRQTIDLEQAVSGTEGVVSLWARQKIESLMNDQWIHNDTERHREEIISLSEKHGILSAFTAFLAVEKTPVRDPLDPLHEEKIKNLLPAGNEMLMVNLPQGATGANAWLAAALLLLMMSLVPKLAQRIRR
ncbi:MAG: marine proteobacterial sortase target protein [Gammaproteobacteria bacterium]|nr:marine proteobacterial sortase target protein [Gammaproteobacteria bacterium]